jgi:RNA ligase (TIGR02306 family)
MSEFHVEVVRIGPVEKHPNADSLSITQIHGGYPCIFRTGEYQEGDLAVYVPIDSICPNNERFAFLEKPRIKAKKLRGVFSMGLLTPALPEWTEGQDVAEQLGITKWEPEMTAAENGRSPRLSRGPLNQAANAPSVPVYDIEGYRKYRDLFQEGEPVYVTEKIHGCNARYVFTDDEFFVGSRQYFVKETEGNVWWEIAKVYELEEICRVNPDMVIFGEIYGDVQDLKYGHKQGERSFTCFDVMDLQTGKYLDVEEFLKFCDDYELSTPPRFFMENGWNREEAEKLAEGESWVSKNTAPFIPTHVREGIVIKPMVERFDRRVGRVFLKLVGQGYLLRKGS